jgi:hypothetical protein
LSSDSSLPCLAVTIRTTENGHKPFDISSFKFCHSNLDIWYGFIDLHFTLEVRPLAKPVKVWVPMRTAAPICCTSMLNDAIGWNRVEQILMAHYTVGTGIEGVDAYPPLLRFKGMLLLKRFRINSDRELENQIHPAK